MGSGNYSKYSFTYSAGDTDFYGNDPLYPKILTTGESSLTASAIKIVAASASMSGSANSSATAYEIQLAQPTFDGDVATVTIALEILKGQIFLDGNASLAISGTKEAYASSTLSSSGNLSTTAIEILIPGVNPVGSNVSLTASGTKIATASVVIPVTSNSTSSAIRIPGINLAVSGSVNLTATSLKQAYSSVSISDGDGQLTATSFKFAYSESALSSDGTLVATSLKQAYSQSALSSASSASITALEILFGVVDLTSTSTSVIVGKEILYANTSIDITSDLLLAGTTRFSPNILEDVETIRTLISIDGKPLSEHNRQFNSNIIQSFIENRNWASTRARYYKSSSGRKTFSINWTMLPSLRDQTVDKRFGRDKVHEIATDPDVHTLKLLNFDSDGTTPYTETEYNVLVKSYSENLIRRDINNDMYLWDCTIELEEV